MRAVIIGATAGVGRSLAERLARQTADLVLIGRDARDLEVVADDLRLRSGAKIYPVLLDVAGMQSPQLCEAIAASVGVIDALFVIAGVTDPDDRGLLSETALDRITQVNFVGPAKLINALLPLCGPACHIVIAGSVAAIRPRGVNFVYGASKAALEFYAMGLRHAFGSRLDSVACYRLGYISTAMTFGQQLPFPATSPEAVADVMVKNLGRSGVFYFPGWWSLLAMLLVRLPWSLYKNLRA